MKNKYARILVLLTVLIFFLVACSDNKDPQQNGGNQTETSELSQITSPNKVDVIDRDNAIRVIPVIEEDSDTEETSLEESKTEESTVEETTLEESNQTVSKNIPKEINDLDDNIYNLEVMEMYHKDNIDMSQYDGVDQVIEAVLNEYGVDRSAIGIAYYNFHTDNHYYHNEDQLIVAASTAKVPIVMAYIDLINAGHYSYDTQLLYNDYYYREGNGNIANSPSQVSYSIADLMHEAIVYSDNTAWYTLVFNYPNNFGGIASYILDKTGFYNVPEYFWMDNYATAYLYEQLLIQVATDPSYEYLVELMKQTQPSQLFTSYINTEVFANKYGRVDYEVNDMGIYYENNQPQYILVAFTSELAYADNVLEDLNLYVNLWFRQNFILN